MQRSRFFRALPASMATVLAITFPPGAAGATAQAPPSAAPPAFTASASLAASSAAPDFVDQGAYRRVVVGRMRVIAISDGTVVRNAQALVTKLPGDEVERLLKSGFRDDSLELSINAFLVDDGVRRVLIDVGSGDLFKPDGGQLVVNMRKAGYEPDQVNAVVLTHIHADHSGGLTVDGRPVFSHADIYVPEADFKTFLDPAWGKSAPPAMKAIYAQSHASLDPYVARGKVHTFHGLTEVLPGITALPAPGHTPGHSFIEVHSDGQRMRVLGDTIHVAEVQFQRPGAAVTLDVDQDAAVAQRRKGLDEVASEGELVAFEHVSFPGLGHVRKVGDGYVWVPLPYSVRP